MKKKLHKVGNSHGLLFTKDMLDHLGVEGVVEVVMEPGRIVVTRVEPTIEEIAAEAIERYGKALSRLAK
jgi:antitoxin component of MazEF toxin-antitoxin module